MKPAKTLAVLGASAVCLSAPQPLLAEEGGFIKDATATLQARNYFFSRDYSDIRGPEQSMAQEWAQGFILNFKSGYTPGTLGLGLDAIGTLGLKLDSGRGRVNSGLLPVQEDGEAADDYSRLGLALKLRLAKSELRIGELQPNLPVLSFSDIRLLPPSYQGASIVSNDIDGLTLQGGRLRSTSLRNESGDGKLQAMLGHVPKRVVSSDAFNYAGADYAFNDKRTSLSAWYGQLEDIYHQRFLGLKHSQPLGDWILGANLGYYDSEEDGKQLLGAIDNQAFFSLLSAKRGGHTFYLGYQGMFGDSAFPRVFANITPLGNEVPTYEFAYTDERSWQLRYDYDFAASGLPGLTSTVRYIRGGDVDTGKGFEGKDWERDLDIGYVVQSGPLGGLGIKVRNVVARSNYRTDINENRLLLSYSWKLF
ncbi:OprD family porin [Pseudomonas chlororaphis]|uniref:Benzoate-specific porin n=1 Tax=Pseudomonas chlororaphis TaxID=587753 RepID=A0AAX3FR51_9PSED|nr:OprD family porin [Pseudomonas chlororaphis]AZC38739.1 Outer membrane low permeability porin, OprD family [Pseudomonas chlororaphis subsp. piscium]AZC45289.1 Outer membrane low permeability porin, OprD family [Pseudomonas chlororaphis subsp. piscium]WDG70854.1 OprD family porin [Pseudomonas chlororaphis]WDH31360.1 OprD family porin [Pseudomonas chlororaphis]WDH69380.1 OprD family porin [Pseudomonas chlororaphis]